MNDPQKERKKALRIGVTMGDPNGIGPETILKLLEAEEHPEGCWPIVYGSEQVLEHYRKLLGLRGDGVKASLDLVECWEEDLSLEPGKPTKEAGEFAFRSLKRATEDIAQGDLDALVTAPLNKWTVRTDERPFPGHTEFLTERFGAEDSLMFMISEKLRVGVVTGHIPLHEVPSSIQEKRILRKLEILEQSLRFDLGIEEPKIALTGLNPHAGESGMLGKEETSIIGPTLEKARREHARRCEGPFSADGLFGSEDLARFDAVLAMYHDQGLIPFKALTFGRGVNFTAGLPIVRTSPDHGTGYSIAGQGKASSSSMRNAILLAMDIARHRAYRTA